MSAVSEFPDLPSLESQLRQHATDLPLRVISTVWASDSSYHPGYLMPRSTRVVWEVVKRTYGSGPHTSMRTFFFLISLSPTFGRSLVQRFVIQVQEDHDKVPSGIPRVYAMDDLSILPTLRCLVTLSGAGILDTPSTNSFRRKCSGCATAKSIRGCNNGKGGSPAGLRDA